MQVAAGVVGAPPMPVPVAYQLTHQRARAGSPTEEEFGDIIVKTGEHGRGHPAARRRPARAGARRLRACARCSTTRMPSAIGIFQAPGSNALAALE